MIITYQTLKNPIVLFTILLLSYFCIKGILVSFDSSKDYLIDLALEEQGIILKRQEITILQRIAQLDSSIKRKEEQLPVIDYQKQKKYINHSFKHVDHEPAQTKNITLDNNTIYMVDNATKELITKWEHK